jgi:hypothetical protein
MIGRKKIKACLSCKSCRKRIKKTCQKNEGEGRHRPSPSSFQAVTAASLFAARNRAILDRTGNAVASLLGHVAFFRRTANFPVGVCERKSDACGKKNSGAKRQCFIFHDVKIQFKFLKKNDLTSTKICHADARRHLPMSKVSVPVTCSASSLTSFGMTGLVGKETQTEKAGGFHTESQTC